MVANLTIVENGLIPILADENHNNLVDARTLWKILGIKKKFYDWIKDQFRILKLEENQDWSTYAPVGEKVQCHRPSVEYVLKMRSAKQIAMASQSDKGIEIRDYFIEAEERLQKTYKQGGLDLLKHAFNVATKQEMFVLLVEQKGEIDRLECELKDAQLETTEAKTEVMEAQKEVKNVKKVVNLISNTPYTYSLTEVAKYLGITYTKLKGLLLINQWVYENGSFVYPKSKYDYHNKGWFKLNLRIDRGKKRNILKITAKGLCEISERLCKDGFVTAARVEEVRQLVFDLAV